MYCNGFISDKPVLPQSKLLKVSNPLTLGLCCLSLSLSFNVPTSGGPSHRDRDSGD